MEYLLGCDLSHHQDDDDGVMDIDFRQMRRMGVDFCYIKCSEGDYYPDHDFARNWDACGEAGIIPGAYHFIRAYDKYTQRRLTGEQNVEYFLEQFGNRDLFIPHALDVEDADGQSNPYMTSVVQNAALALGYPNEIYTGNWFWRYHILPWSQWKESQLWVMTVPWYDAVNEKHFPNHELFLEYLEGGTRFPTIPMATDGKPSWDSWSVWQFSHQGDGRLYGLERGVIDLDIAKPSILIGIPEPPDPPPPPVIEMTAELNVYVGTTVYSGVVDLTENKP